MAADPRISVVIAAYRPGDGFDRVIASLDAQTLPQDQFETIVVDDGSPDDTLERLTGLAATRTNMRVERIENSGWPSRPRNVATDLARGEYVFFMDHDDSLYPDALRRMAEYATETHADLLSPKESKTSDAWWGLPALADGNVANALTDGGIDRLLPMVPHKLYRTAFLREHGIRFPEGRRQLWEDIYVNVEAWRHAEHVAALADTPVYLWWSSQTNNSKTYGPRTEEFWDRLDELFAFIDRTLDGPEFAEARRSALLHQYRGRVLLRLSRNLQRATPDETAMAIDRARTIQDRYIPEEWDAALRRQVRARAVLLRAGRADLMAALWAEDANTSARVVARRPAWRNGALHLELEARWSGRKGRPIGLLRRDGRVLRDLSPELVQALPDEVLDFTYALSDLRLEVAIRDRGTSVSWQLLVDQRTSWMDLENGQVAPKVIATVAIDPATAALGAPLQTSVHDVVAKMQWDGSQRATGVVYRGPAAPALLPHTTAVAYRSQRNALALDLSAQLRNIAADGGILPGRVAGDLRALELELPNVAVYADAALPATLRLHPTSADDDVVLHADLIAEGGRARLVTGTSASIPDGAYELAIGLADGPPVGARPVHVLNEGLIVDPPERPAPSRSGSLPSRALSAMLRGLLGKLRRRIQS